MGEVHQLHRGGQRRSTDRTGPVDLATEPPFALGSVRVSPADRTLECGGERELIEPKAMQVLSILAREPGAVFSRDRLIELCWDGRVVGDSSVARIISMLRAQFRDLGEDGVVIETLPKVGYRLSLPDDLEGIASPKPADDDRDSDVEHPSEPDRHFWLPRPPLLVAGIAALLLLVVGITWLVRPTPADETLTIAMLPLTSKDGIEPLLASGFEAELRREIARSDGLSVTASDTARQLDEDDRTPEQIGRVLGADYVWQGRLVGGEGQLAIETLLVEVASGREIANTTLASADAHAAALPLRTARSLLDAIGRPLEADTATADVAPADYDLYLTALGLIRSRDVDAIYASLQMLGGVVERNPRFPGGYSARAKAAMLTLNLDPADVENRHENALADARRALALDPESTEALKAMAMLSQNPQKRFEYISRAVELDPGDGEAWLWYSHIAAHPDYAGEELRAMRRMIAMDPLWGRTWQASFVAAAEDGMPLAESIEEEIATAAAEPWQRDAARARVALLHGDVSEFQRLTLGAMSGMPNDHRQIASMHLANARLLMGTERREPSVIGPAGIVQDALDGRLPPRRQMEAAGVSGRAFFMVTPLVIAGPPQLIRQGRGDELIAYYEEAFGSPDALEAFAQTQLRSHHVIAQTATYVGFAMKQAGREEDARALFDLAERSVAMWRANGGMTMTPSLFEANLAAARGQRQRAVDAVARLPQYGWPWSLQSPGAAHTGPLLDDPLWDELQGDLALRAIVEPIKARIASERAEIAEAS